MEVEYQDSLKLALEQQSNELKVTVYLPLSILIILLVQCIVFLFVA